MNNGKLYVIGTPIGNLGDITLRAIETLNLVEILVCEDSRVASRLINSLTTKGLLTNKPRYFAYNEFNEDRVWQQVVRWIMEGKVVGLVSDAGMPTISDPGYKVIRGTLDWGGQIEVIPGVSALTTALPYSAVGGEAVVYLGFLPKTRGKAEKLLQAGAGLLAQVKSGKIVLYVSPHRLEKELQLIREVMGNIRLVLMRELTKQYEERIEGTVEKMIERCHDKPLKGEIVMVISQETTAGHTRGGSDTHDFKDGGSDIAKDSTA